MKALKYKIILSEIKDYLFYLLRSKRYNLLKGGSMNYHITHIRLSDHFSSSPSKITHVKLVGGTIETTAEVAYFIDIGCHYSYTNKAGQKLSVGSVHPMNRTPYIHTRKRVTSPDELLFLPLF